MDRASNYTESIKNEMDQMENKMKFLMEDKKDIREGLKHEEMTATTDIITNIEMLTKKVSAVQRRSKIWKNA